MITLLDSLSISDDCIYILSYELVEMLDIATLSVYYYSNYIYLKVRHSLMISRLQMYLQVHWFRPGDACLSHYVTPLTD